MVLISVRYLTRHLSHVQLPVQGSRCDIEGVWLPRIAKQRRSSWGMFQMQLERHRARRYSFHASIELTDLQSETQIKEQTSDLSLFGCHVDTVKPLAPGTKVRIKISHRGEYFEALGKVANARPNAGIGIVFTRIEPNDQLVLDKWIAEPRDK